MKIRAFAVIDYDLPEGFKQAAEEQSKLEAAINELVRGNPHVVFKDLDIRQRRGNKRPDIKNMKLRSS